MLSPGFTQSGPHCKRCRASSLFSIKPSCQTAPSSGGNCLDHHPLGIGGPLSGSIDLRSCCWTWHPLEILGITEKWSGVSHSCPTTRGSSFTTWMWRSVPGRSNGCAGEPSGITQLSGPQAARRITTRPGRGRRCPRWPSRARCGAMRGPSLPLQLLKVALRNLLWIVASLELAWERRPWIAHAAPASTHGSPRSFRDPPFLRKGRKVCSEFNTTASCPRSTSDCPGLHAGKGARHLATVCRGALLPALVPGRSHLFQAERRNEVGRRDRRTTDSGGPSGVPRNAT